jgi:hypothetical protein
VNRDIAANLDEQQNKLTALCAQDSARIRGTKEDRNAAKLAALSSQYNAAADAQQQGFEYNSRRRYGGNSIRKNMAMKSTGKFSGKGTEVPLPIGFKSKYK